MTSLPQTGRFDHSGVPALESDISDIELLHSISIELIGEHDLTELYSKVVDAAVSITQSQFGTMQRLCPPNDPSGRGGELQLLSHRGLSPDAVAFWQWVPPSAHSSCTKALKLGHRAVIPDFEKWDEIAGTEDLLAFRRADIRSAQTTPLRSRNGILLGMISTHWSEPHIPSERDLRLLDILARQAADLLERTLAEEVLLARQQDLERSYAALQEAQQRQHETEGTLRHLNETLEIRVEERSRELMASAEQIRHMQKMEAIGQLTGGVAHDFNNLLTVIRASADLLTLPDVTDEKRVKYATAIANTAVRAAKLTSQLLAFARRQALLPEVFNVGGRVNAIADMLRTIVGSRIELTINEVGAQSFAELDASQFETALVNMAVNARDAMNGEGRLVIDVDTVDGIPPVRHHAGSPGKFVKVAVTDTGSGIPTEQIDRIFEPFFTTKALGKGTGLGLSQVYGFIKQSGGQIAVTSRLGYGTTFTVYLPKAEASEKTEDTDIYNAADFSGTSVLIVEDNEHVRDFAAQLLIDLGYETRHAANAIDAISILEQEHNAIDVVFTDVVMPGVDGIEMGRQIRSRWPRIKVVLTSGYSHVLANNTRHGFSVLHKPYSVGDLSRAIRTSTASATKKKAEESVK